MQGEHWVEALGTVVAISGLAVVAPYQAGKALPDLARWLTRRWRTVRGWLARFLRFLRRDATVHGVTAFGRLNLSGTGTIAFSGHVTPPGTTLAERVDILWREMAEVRLEIATLRASTETRLTEVGERINKQAEALVDLEARVDYLVRDTARLNARGFPLAALGTVLAGLSFWFVSWWWLPLFLLAAALAASFLHEAAPKIREGWSAAGA